MPLYALANLAPTHTHSKLPLEYALRFVVQSGLALWTGTRDPGEMGVPAIKPVVLSAIFRVR